MVAKCLAYDDDYVTLSAATLSPDAALEDDLEPLLELPDPDEASSTSVISAAPHGDALPASADSCVTEVGGSDLLHSNCLPLRLITGCEFSD